jgi:hypothetical protein
VSSQTIIIFSASSLAHGLFEQSQLFYCEDVAGIIFSASSLANGLIE